MLDFVEAFKRPKCGKLVVEHGELYNKLFLPYQDKAIRMLEIGIWNGVSFKIWKEYFLNATLFGIDMSIPDPALLEIGKIFFGDQSYKRFTDTVAEEIGSLDIVVDDGGHWCDDQQVSFNSFWPIVNSGGLYIIEDLWVAEDRVLDGYESTLVFLDKLDIRKEFYRGTNNFEKDICVLYKE